MKTTDSIANQYNAIANQANINDKKSEINEQKLKSTMNRFKILLDFILLNNNIGTTRKKIIIKMSSLFTNLNYCFCCRQQGTINFGLQLCH